MKKQVLSLFCLVATCSVYTAAAADAPAREAIGQDARRWVELQVSGEAAERGPDGMPGEVAERVWQRYLDSFTHPIPEQFARDGFVEGGD